MWSNEDGLLRSEAAHSYLLSEATRFLKSQRAYSRPELAIVACGQIPQDFLSHKSRLSPGKVVTLDMSLYIPGLGEVAYYVIICDTKNIVVFDHKVIL